MSDSDILETIRGLEDFAGMGFYAVWTLRPNGRHRVAVGKEGSAVVIFAEGASLPEAFDRLLPQVHGLNENAAQS